MTNIKPTAIRTILNVERSGLMPASYPTALAGSTVDPSAFSLRWYNAAMSKPFQFSIIAMLVAVAAAGVTARVVASLIPLWHPSLIAAFFGCFAFCGAIVGSATDRPIRGMLAGIFLATLLIIGFAVLDHVVVAIRE